MPLILPKNLPAAEALERENIFVMPEERARNQDIRPLRIVVVNQIGRASCRERV